MFQFFRILYFILIKVVSEQVLTSRLFFNWINYAFNRKTIKSWFCIQNANSIFNF